MQHHFCFLVYVEKMQHQARIQSNFILKQELSQRLNSKAKRSPSVQTQTVSRCDTAKLTATQLMSYESVRLPKLTIPNLLCIMIPFHKSTATTFITDNAHVFNPLKNNKRHCKSLNAKFSFPIVGKARMCFDGHVFQLGKTSDLLFPSMQRLNNPQ